MAIRSIAVFCGSKSGNNPLFEAHTRQLGHLLAENNITLIYGGGNKGLMAAVANEEIKKTTKYKVFHEFLTTSFTRKPRIL